MSLQSLPTPSTLHHHWALDSTVVFLNHGSFGACPVRVQEAQRQRRAQMEAEPVRFFLTELPPLHQRAREVLATFLGADAQGIALTTNATSGVNTVLRSLSIKPGDELLVSDHEYNASRNALDFVAERAGARVVVVPIPFPIPSEALVIERFLERVSPATRLCMVDHITSQTGLVLPVAELVQAMTERGIETLIDGAHAPGMVPLDLETLGAAYVTGNCHKWLCTPKGCAYLYVRADLRETIRPLSISHGANAPLREGQSRFEAEFDWTGTQDPTAQLVLPEALETLASLDPDGLPGVMRANRALALAGRDLLCEALQIPAPCPDSMVGSLAAFPLPDSSPGTAVAPLQISPLQRALYEDYRIQVPIVPWPGDPHRLIRISAQRYNSLEQYAYLAQALKALLGRS